MRTNWIARRGSFSSRSSPRSFDMLGGAASLPSSSDVVSVVRCSWLVFFRACPVARSPVASRAVVASSCLACSVSLVRASPFLRLVCLLSVPLYRRIARLPDRSTSGAGRWRVASRLGFALITVACCLPWRCRGCGGGGVSLVGLARCRRVDGVGGLRDFRRLRCLLWVILSGWRVSLVPCCLLRPSLPSLAVMGWSSSGAVVVAPPRRRRRG